MSHEMRKSGKTKTVQEKVGRSLLFWWIVVGFLFVFVLISLWAPIVIRVQFVRDSGDDEGVLSIRYFFGLIRWQRKLTELDAALIERGSLFQLRSKTTNERQNPQNTEHKLTIREVWQVISHWQDWVEFMKKTTPIMKDLFSKIRFDGLQVHLAIGTGDVVASGIVCGVMSALIHTMFGYLSSYSYMCCEPDVSVHADFHKTVVNARVHCIFQVRAGHAIKAIFRLFRVWKRRPTYGTPHSGTHANSHGEYS
jgi:hypothetical protein